MPICRCCSAARSATHFAAAACSSWDCPGTTSTRDTLRRCSSCGRRSIPQAFPILLAHHPHGFDAAAAGRIAADAFRPHARRADHAKPPHRRRPAPLPLHLRPLPKAWQLATGLQRHRQLVSPPRQRTGGAAAHHASIVGVTGTTFSSGFWAKSRKRYFSPFRSPLRIPTKTESKCLTPKTPGAQPAIPEG